jgi:hypothetical protein
VYKRQVWDRWVAEDGKDYLQLEVKMRGTLHKFIDYQGKKTPNKEKQKTPTQAKQKTPTQEKQKTPTTQEKRQEKFKPSVNTEDAKNKREKTLEDRQTAKREKKLQKARGIMIKQMKAAEKVPTDDEKEDNNYDGPDSAVEGEMQLETQSS